MKTISMVAFRRPDYTRETLASLRAQPFIQEYHLFIALEPGYPATLDACKEANFMDCTIRVNPTVLGVTNNNLQLYEKVFEAGSSFNVAIEDDTPLAPDALRLAEWFNRLPHCNDYWVLNLFNGSRIYERPLDVAEYDAFCPWGFCMTPMGFERVRSNWMCDSRGWDWSICAAMRRVGAKSLKPHLSRSRNIGRTLGVYCTPEYHDHCFDGHVHSNGTEIGEFVLMK